ncbi:N-acyl amino acid synthase FeeM domain-containing protein [Macromonas nakdongensis]|uniref:N-acyl amino acid synthase FeeM domain-containing protein n=1 Tax=Macromonas nakdongensis TaxID=1843082 RepID=UPI0012FE7FB7|nr:hypothetical protein [Macromonas nakdongensis]
MYSSAVSEVLTVPAVAALARRVQAPADHPAVRRHLQSESLPFTVRVVRESADLQKAVAIRHAAYARHLAPSMTAALQQPEALDQAPGVVVLLAESKVDGSPLGTMRIQTNTHRPLTLEQSMTLPDWMAGHGLAEATRLGITQDKVGRVVKTVLFKAYYLYCLLHDIRYMVITARAPIDRQYDRLLFQDVYPGMGYMPLEHVFNLPHRIMYLDVYNVERLWKSEGHPLSDYMFHTRHPDLVLV